MNRKVAVVLLLTFVALVVLTLYSFGPLAGKRRAARPKPQSLKPAASVVQGDVSFHNRDSRENYFGITVPKAWDTKAGDLPGSYRLAFDHGTGTVELMDVPDNSTLELYILSQDEPRLKAKTTGYARAAYEKQSLGGVEAYRLSYLRSAGGGEERTVREYVSGQDMAGVLTFTTPATDSSSWPAIDSVIAGFRWEN